jgi:putative SOS response-associated peptidase YedK
VDQDLCHRHDGPNALVADIHNRMPLILAAADYARRLGDDLDPGDLMRSFPAELMRMWPISTRVSAAVERYGG